MHINVHTHTQRALYKIQDTLFSKSGPLECMMMKGEQKKQKKKSRWGMREKLYKQNFFSRYCCFNYRAAANKLHVYSTHVVSDECIPRDIITVTDNRGGVGGRFERLFRGFQGQYNTIVVFQQNKRYINYADMSSVIFACYLKCNCKK